MLWQGSSVEREQVMAAPAFQAEVIDLLSEDEASRHGPMPVPAQGPLPAQLPSFLSNQHAMLPRAPSAGSHSSHSINLIEVLRDESLHSCCAY